MICKEILACILKFSTTPWAKVLRCAPPPCSLAPSQIGFPDRHRSRAGWAQCYRGDGMLHTNCPDHLVASDSPPVATLQWRSGDPAWLGAREEGGGAPNLTCRHDLRQFCATTTDGIGVSNLLNELLLKIPGGP